MERGGCSCKPTSRSTSCLGSSHALALNLNADQQVAINTFLAQQVVSASSNVRVSGMHAKLPIPDSFCESLRQYSNSERRKKLLWSRQQTLHESVEQYVNEMVNLAKQIDPTEVEHISVLRAKSSLVPDLRLYIQVGDPATLTVNGLLEKAADAIEALAAKDRSTVDKKGIKRLQGMCAFLISFIPNFSTLFQPLSKLLSKKVSFTWDNEQQLAFENLKKILGQDIVLQGLDYKFPIYIRTDSSDYGIGGCLCQEIDGTERIACYASKTLSIAESKYNICEKECYAILFCIRKFQPFLLGEKFIVYTDNRALTFLKTMNDKSRNLANWSHEIERWGCEIKFCPGKQNVVADCLSRAPLDPSPGEPDHLTSRSNSLASSAFHKYKIENGILYRKIFPFDCKRHHDIVHPIPDNGTESTETESGSSSLSRTATHLKCADDEYLSEQIDFEFVPVVPESLKYMSYFHDTPESGHFGISKTQDAIKRRFYWHNMNRDIASYVRSCDVCQRYKSDNMKRKGFLGDVPVAKSVQETLFIDFIGPYTVSKRRNRFCLVVVDQLSSWVELKPMSTATSSKVVDFLEEIFCRFGVPKVIMSDNAQNLIGKTMKHFLKQWGVKHVVTSAYHPQSNRAERTNKDLVRMIASFCQESQKDWDLHLQSFALALRSHVNDTLKVTPSQVMLGRHIALPIDRSLQANTSENYDLDARELASCLPTKMKELIEYITKNIHESHLKNKHYYDKKRRHYEFNMGEQFASALYWRRQGLKVLALSSSAHQFRVELNSSDDSRFQHHPTPEKARDFKLGKRHIIPIFDIPSDKNFINRLRLKKQRVKERFINAERKLAGQGPVMLVNTPARKLRQRLRKKRNVKRKRRKGQQRQRLLQKLVVGRECASATIKLSRS
ncbi:Transposon Ty3-I Gag-Pol polyprotein [Orchesella cincta]|uniref:RNA-directed DNA polymerase n=1 Tax=Orchesella cincta TaxID=48709 RepID=A0A1D2M8F5_ORCCI|nr:Transposon Ty3-I Gag-Pol polyprotein [Orchesella cincta]